MRSSRHLMVRASIALNLMFVISLVVFLSALFSDNSSDFYIEPIRDFPCKDTVQISYLGQRGQHWVLYNYITPEFTFRCERTITFTTHADMTFLDKIVPLVERWKGPVSVALYSPGTDFENTIERINFLRYCSSPSSSSLVRKFVSFHLFFDQENIPENVKTFITTGESSSNNSKTFSGSNRNLNQNWNWNRMKNLCNKKFNFGPFMSTFRRESNILYPINVARNIAREMATTHFVLSSDIEMFPSLDLIPRFLNMMDRIKGVGDSKFETSFSHQNKVFVVPHYEVLGNVTMSMLPNNKADLQELLQKNLAQSFHKFACSACHSIPRQGEWEKSGMTSSDLNIFHTGKRTGGQMFWEPFYIGTKFEPMFDERLSLEGRANKMIQNYIMCLLDYEYHILNNDFLIHGPGIKQKGLIPSENYVVAEQYKTILETIVPEVDLLYGKKEECKVMV